MPSYTKRPGFERELANTPYVSSGQLAQRVAVQNNTQFDEVLTASRTPIIELNSSYGTSILRDLETVTNSAAISSSSSGEILLSTGTTASSSALLESAEVARYIPGYSAELGLGVRVPVDPTGNIGALWGGLTPDEQDGFYFGVDATGVFTAYKRNGTETKVRPAGWNIDPLDGTGPSGYSLDISNGVIYQIRFTWYGYGQILFGVVDITPPSTGETVANGYRYDQGFIPCHSLKVDGTTSVESPNLRVFAKADNGGDASDFDLYIGGRQFSIIGTYRPKYRDTTERTDFVTVGTTRIPLISFRRKTGFSDRSIKLEGSNLIVDGTEVVNWEIVLDGTLTGASFGNPSNHLAAETALEVDTSATAISGGHVVYGDMVEAGGNNRFTSSGASLELDLPDDLIISLCAYTDATTSDVKSVFRLREEW